MLITSGSLRVNSRCDQIFKVSDAGWKLSHKAINKILAVFNAQHDVCMNSVLLLY